MRQPAPAQQPNLALQRIAESLPQPRHKGSTDEVFNEPQRLHKILASCGFGSRRAMEELILAGRITVNRMPAEIGQKVGPGDEVRINGEPVKIRFAEPKPRVLMYHKPAGEIVTRDDPENRPTVFEQLPPIHDAKWIAVGRLDYNTEGLLLFTNSGELANRLMHPRYEVEREYAVRVLGRLTDEQAHELTHGVELDDGPARCERIEDGGGDEDSANHWYNVVVREGRNREVRRLFEAVGLTVSRLIRVRYGKVAMPSTCKRGDVVELDPQALQSLLQSVGLNPQGGASAGPVPARPGKQGRPSRPGGQPGPKGYGQPRGGHGKPRGQGNRPGGGQPRTFEGPMRGGRDDYDPVSGGYNPYAASERPAYPPQGPGGQSRGPGKNRHKRGAQGGQPGVRSGPQQGGQGRGAPVEANGNVMPGAQVTSPAGSALPGAPRKRKRRRGKGGGQPGSAPAQRVEGLPKDEEVT